MAMSPSSIMHSEEVWLVNEVWYNCFATQMEVCVNLTRKLPSNCASLSGSLSRLSLSVARYPNLEMTILKPVSHPTKQPT